MVSDQDIANGVETLLRQSDPKLLAVTSINTVVQQLEAALGLDLSHKTAFIRDHISLLLRSHPHPSTDHFGFHPQFHPHFALHHPPPPPPPPPPPKPDAFVQNATAVPEVPKESAPARAKRRGGSGGLNKVCSVSPELQAIVGKPALPRTEIVKQLWAYIRKNNLQDPRNKRKILCDDALRSVFEIDCTDMFKMNKLLAKHISPLETTKVSGQSQAKRLKVDVEAASESSEAPTALVIISEPLAKFFGTEGREMMQSEATRRAWEYIKVNHLEDPLNSMVIHCDAKLQELFGCESISALGVSEMLARHHLFKRS